MDRKNFDKLDLKSQVEYINKRLTLGESLRKISDDIGIQRKTIRVRFKKINYEFNKESNKYICNTNVLHNDSKVDKFKNDYKCNTDVMQNKFKEESEKKYKDNTNVVQRNKENKIKKEYECNANIIQDEIKKKDKLEYNCITSNEKENKYKEYKDNTIVLQDNVKEDFFQLIEAKEDLFKMMQWFKKQKFEDRIIEIPELKIDKDKFKGEVKVTTIRVYSKIKDKFQEFAAKFPEYKSQDLYTQALLEFIMKYEKI